jgi:putative Ca2+/H+ antiporter (TMEM165/GDT1 family)
MSGFVEILVTAFGLQLLALPGEKGQLIIGGLATEYNPYFVVAGATTAFGGWTVVEILLGESLKGSLPEMYLDGVTAGLFFVFAAWILSSSAPVSQSFSPELSLPVVRNSSWFPAESESHGFVTSFLVMVFGEFGDKTQIITIGLAIQYGASPAIWLGEMAAIVPVSLATALVFNRSTRWITRRWIRRFAASLFLLFALDIVAKYSIGRSFLPF